MIVTAWMIWWNERPQDLDRTVRGVATIADKLVAVDGAYSRYPDATIRSPKEQEAAIRAAAKDVGLKADIVIPDRLWAGGVEKRAFALARASQDTDWVVALDADWVISGDRRKVRAELAHAGPEVEVLKANIHHQDSDNEPATGWHAAIAGTEEWINHIYRALPEMSCERYHWWFTAKKGKRKVYIWGPADGRPLLPAFRLEAPYRIEHMTLHRTRDQIRASRAFLNDRALVVALTDQEDDMDDLPRPEFDFDTILDARSMRRARRLMSARQRHALRRRGIG